MMDYSSEDDDNDHNGVDHWSSLLNPDDDVLDDNSVNSHNTEEIKFKDQRIKCKRKLQFQCRNHHFPRLGPWDRASFSTFHNSSSSIMHSIFILVLLYQLSSALFLVPSYHHNQHHFHRMPSPFSFSLLPLVSASFDIEPNSNPRPHYHHYNNFHNKKFVQNYYIIRPLVGADVALSSYDKLSTSGNSGATATATTTSGSAGNCASVCVCIWKSGKQTATCDHRSLITVPTGLATTTQVIDLSGNMLGHLGPGVFQDRGLVNLQRIFLVNCRLAEISSETFQKLSNLIELDLANNSLSVIPSKSLVECVALRRLSLTGNQIIAVKSGAFLTLSRLQVLDLSANQISHLDTDAFRGLRSLQTLKLDRNQLQTLPAAESFVQFLPAKLASLELHDNRWQCDCHLRPIREWIVLNNIPLAIKPNCYSPPRLQGQSWDSISAAEFSCPPQIHSSNGNFYKHIGNNVTISCPVTGYPPPQIYWLFENMILPDGGTGTGGHNRSSSLLNRQISTTAQSSTRFLQSESEMDSDLLELNTELNTDDGGGGVVGGSTINEQHYSHYPPHSGNDSFGYTSDHLLPNFRYQISQDRENHLIQSTLTISGLQPYDSQRIVCVARNIGGIVWKNFSLIVSTQEPFSSSRSMDFIVTEMFVIFVSIAILLVSVLIFVSVFIAKFKKQRRSTSSVYDSAATVHDSNGGNDGGGATITGYLTDIHHTNNDGSTVTNGVGVAPNYPQSIGNTHNLMLMNGNGQIFNANHLVAAAFGGGNAQDGDTGQNQEKCILAESSDPTFHPHPHHPHQFNLYPQHQPPPPHYNQLHHHNPTNGFLSAVPNSNGVPAAPAGTVLMVNTIEFMNSHQTQQPTHPSSLCSSGSTDPNSTDLSSQSTTQSMGVGSVPAGTTVTHPISLKALIPNSTNVSPNNSTDSSSGTYFGGYNSSTTTTTSSTTTSGSQLGLQPLLSNEISVIHQSSQPYSGYPAYATLQRPGRGQQSKPDLVNSSTNSGPYYLHSHHASSLSDVPGSQRVNICDYQQQLQQQPQSNGTDAYPLLNSAELIYGTRIAPTRLTSQPSYLTNSMSCHGKLNIYQPSSPNQSNNYLEQQQQEQQSKSKLVKFADQLDHTTSSTGVPNSYATLRLHNTKQHNPNTSLSNGSNWNGSNGNLNGTNHQHHQDQDERSSTMMAMMMESSVDSGEQILSRDQSSSLSGSSGPGPNKKSQQVEPLDETEEDDYYRNLNGQ